MEFKPKAEEYRDEHVEVKQSKEDEQKLIKLLEKREEFKTEDILLEIIENTESDQLRDVVNILLSNKNLLNESTILRGDTSDGTGIGQTTLEGTFSCVNPQVFIQKYNGHKHTSQLTIEPIIFEDYDRELFNITTLHELIHSFTRYIVAVYEKGKEDDILSEEEKEFYESVSRMHEVYLENNSTGDEYLDKLDEFIAKTTTIHDKSYSGNKFSERMIKAFKKLYKSNTRKIVSLSKYLKL